MQQSAFFGPYRLIRPLTGGSLAERWLALHVRRQTSHVVHRFGVCEDRIERRRYTQALETLSRLDHPHLLGIQQFSFGASGRAFAVTAYPGSHDGLLTLSQLLDQKGGRLGEREGERLLEHLLEASSYAQEMGLCHGALGAHEVLVDRGGRVLIEHYGLARAIRGGIASESARSEEALSIVRLGYEALTGVRAAVPMVRPSRLARLADRGWDSFFSACLEGAGVGTSSGILDMLRRRESEDDGERLGAVRVALRRLRGASDLPRAAE